MLTYSTRRSGAYIFVPDSAASILPSPNAHYILIKNKHAERVIVDYGNSVYATATVYNSSNIYIYIVIKYNYLDCFDTFVNDIPMVELQYSMNLAESHFFNNKELITRFTTDIHNNMNFYTDSNGLDMQLRQVDESRPISSNFYPISMAAMLADSNSKISLLTAHPLGFGSLKEGQFEVMLDRRLAQDVNIQFI
jgi:hypothetical protein